MDGMGMEMLKPSTPREPPRPRVHEIQTLIAKEWGVTVDDLRSPCRKAQFAKPRQIAMALARQVTRCSYPQIGQMFGDRDHTTVLFAYRKVVAAEAANESFAQEMEGYRQALAEIVAQRAPPPVSVPLTIEPPISTDVAEANAALAYNFEAPRWTHLEMATLRALWRLGFSPKRIAEALPDKTPKAIADKASVMGLGARKRCDDIEIAGVIT